MLDVKVHSTPPKGEWRLAIACFRDEEPDLSGLPGAVAKAARGAAEIARASEERFGSVAVDGGGGQRVSVRELGPRGRFDVPLALRWLQRELSSVGASGAPRLVAAIPPHPVLTGRGVATTVLRELSLAGYRFDRKSSVRDSRPLALGVLPPEADVAAYRRARGTARIVAESVATTRDLANSPPNEATPEWMAARAREIAKRHGLKVEVLGPKQLERRGMGGILAVGRGSRNTPRMVRLTWGEGDETVSLVGKGVTFDTGGISLKPPSTMDEMKFDKSGACTVLGVVEGAARLELPYRFRAYVALAENMPDGDAYRPGDIVTCMNGKTVEILNTDAEGRMLLADALSWAVRDKPDTLIDYATLTGACVVALGHHGAGLFTDDDGLAGELLGASATSGERLWRLPTWPEFRSDMRGRQADLRNSGTRWGGANTAAAFLAAFAGDVERWAHLDIAGTAWNGGDTSPPFGATGYGVALTLTWLLRRAGKL